MKNLLSKKDFLVAEKKLNNLLNTTTKKGGFEFLTLTETAELEKYTQLVKEYEAANFIIETPQTVQELIAFKMFEKKLKQKEIAKLLHTTDTKLSEIMHHKRKPNITFLKSLHQILEIDGNLLLKIV
jgi:HTH-type transcriptional regulator/antitoxin HigA